MFSIAKVVSNAGFGGQALMCSSTFIPTPPSPFRTPPSVISDAGSGGQALMCSLTFLAVQHMTEELGCVTHEGMNYRRLHATKSPWTFGLLKR